MKKVRGISLILILMLILSTSGLQLNAASRTENSEPTKTASGNSETSKVTGNSSGATETSKATGTTSGTAETSKTTGNTSGSTSNNSSSNINKHEHSGGIATCSKKAVCQNCGVEYGELDPTNHSLVDHAAKAPTCEEAGWDAYQTCMYCNYTTYQEKPMLGHTLVEKSDERTHYEECTVCNKKLNREPHKGGTATPSKLAVCEVCGASYGKLDEEHQVIDIPQAQTGLVYNGKYQDGVPEGEGYTLTNSSEKNAGTYVCVVTLDEGNEWSDGTTEKKEIQWTIQRAGVTVHVKDLTLSYGQAEPKDFPVEYRGLLGDDTIQYEITREEGTDVGTYKLSITGEPKQDNYHVNFAPGKLTIQPAEVNADVSIYNKWFDGTVDADVTIQVKGVNGDKITINGVTGAFENSRVGANKKVILDSSKAQILINDSAENADKLKNYVITIPDTVLGKIQGPYICEDGEGSKLQEESKENSKEESSETAAEISQNSSDATSGIEGQNSETSSETSGSVAGNTSDQESGEISVETSSETSGEVSDDTSAEISAETSDSTSEETSKASTQEENEETKEALRQLTSGDNWTLIWFVIFSLLGCFIAGIILAWKAESEPKN